MRHWDVRATDLVRMLALVAVLAGAQLGLLAEPAHAAERVIRITADGPDPVTLAGVKVGDVITFRNADPTFPHGVGSTSDNWSFSASLGPGEELTTAPLRARGTYTYDEGPSVLDDYEGSVVVGSTATAKPKPRPTSASPRPSSTGSADPTRSPSPTASATGSASTPPLGGGGVPTTTPSPTGPPPVTAPPPTETEDPDSGGGTVALPGGTLPEPPTPREYGLPIAVATVGTAGVASLLVRFLLAHPAGRRQDRPLVTLDSTTGQA